MLGAHKEALECLLLPCSPPLHCPPDGQDPPWAWDLEGQDWCRWQRGAQCHEPPLEGLSRGLQWGACRCPHAIRAQLLPANLGQTLPLSWVIPPYSLASLPADLLAWGSVHTLPATTHDLCRPLAAKWPATHPSGFCKRFPLLM